MLFLSGALPRTLLSSRGIPDVKGVSKKQNKKKMAKHYARSLRSVSRSFSEHKYKGCTSNKTKIIDRNSQKIMNKKLGKPNNSETTLEISVELHI